MAVHRDEPDPKKIAGVLIALILEQHGRDQKLTLLLPGLPKREASAGR